MTLHGGGVSLTEGFSVNSCSPCDLLLSSQSGQPSLYKVLFNSTTLLFYLTQRQSWAPLSKLHHSGVEIHIAQESLEARGANQC